MGNAKLNIWMRNEDCSLHNSWRLDIEIKTCAGVSIFDQLPKSEYEATMEYLKEQFPDANVDYHSYMGTKTIKIDYGHNNFLLNNVSMPVPPGCYVVRVRSCGKKNEWSDSAMIIVSCGKEICVNLIVNDVNVCVNNLIVPLLREAAKLKIPIDEVKVAADVLMKAAKQPIELVEIDLNDRKQSMVKLERAEAKLAVKEADNGLNLLKQIKRNR